MDVSRVPLAWNLWTPVSAGSMRIHCVTAQPQEFASEFALEAGEISEIGDAC